jgi:hypothetical protein
MMKSFRMASSAGSAWPKPGIWTESMRLWCPFGHGGIGGRLEQPGPHHRILQMEFPAKWFILGNDDRTMAIDVLRRKTYNCFRGKGTCSVEDFPSRSTSLHKKA